MGLTARRSPGAGLPGRARGLALATGIDWCGTGVWLTTSTVLMVRVVHLTATPSQDQTVDVPATAPTVPPQAPPPPPRPIRLFGTPNVYVVPAGSPALLYR